MATKTEIHDKKKVITDLVQLKDTAMRLGLYRTARLIDIATQEVGWEIQGLDTPSWQKERQKETLFPSGV